MKPLRLFTAFHANLDFSALPEADRALVLRRCYWPLLRLPEELGIPIGFEMSARTLEILENEDPDWLKRFLRLAETGFVGRSAGARADRGPHRPRSTASTGSSGRSATRRSSAGRRGPGS